MLTNFEDSLTPEDDHQCIGRTYSVNSSEKPPALEILLSHDNET
jgi:hypothetical protein